MFRKQNQKGFTLIELLVVIAIIGILSAVVLASLNTARQKSRDAKRVADIRQLQLALEFHFDNDRAYPTTAQGIAKLVTDGYIPANPVDPLGAAYGYASAAVTSYTLSITMESGTAAVLANDIDAAVAPENVVCTDPIYCVRP